MSAPVFDINADVEEVQKALSGTKKSLVSIQRQVVGTIARGAVKEVKKGITSTTKKRSGDLSRAYVYKVKKDGSSATVFLNKQIMAATNHLIMAKAVTLSYGNEITTKKSFLQVNGDGYFARPKAVRIAPRNFIQKGEDYINSGKYESDLNKVVDKSLKKYWG